MNLKLSAEEAVKLVELLDREVPITRYAPNFRTGEEMDANGVMKPKQPKPSTCYDYFLDYLDCHVRRMFRNMCVCFTYFILDVCLIG